MVILVAARSTASSSGREQAILDLIERWGHVDRSHRKIAHRGAYIDEVFVSASTLLRVALKYRVTLPGEPVRARPVVLLVVIVFAPAGPRDEPVNDGSPENQKAHYRQCTPQRRRSSSFV